MAVSEYSDTVLEEINKTHNEIMFLYTMLKDKQAEAADMVSDLQRVAKQVREMDVETNANVSTSQVEKTVEVVEASESTVSQSAVETVTESKEETEAVLNKNEQILLLHKEGKDEVEIAKTLDCGLGVVRLVLGLYHEA